MTFLLLAGCANDPHVPLNKDFWVKQPKPTIAVAMSPTPQADFRFYGAGLVDAAIIIAANQKFIKYLNEYDLSRFDNLETQFLQNLHQQGIPTQKYSGKFELGKLKNSSETNYAAYERKDFTALYPQLKADQLLLINIVFVGATRHYYGFIPLGAPSAICKMEGRLVNLKTNRTLWRFSTIQQVAVKDHWDQPTLYPNFSQALNQVIAQTNQAVLNDFFSSASISNKAVNPIRKANS